MADNRGLILWVLGGSGVFLLYAAYKNVSPQGLLVKHLGGNADLSPISGGSTALTPAPNVDPHKPAPGGGYADGYTNPGTKAPPAGPDAPNYYQDNLANYRTDGSGNNYSVDSNGTPIALVPGYYQTHPRLFAGTVA